MKISKLLQFLLFGIGAMKMGADDGGSGDGGAAAEAEAARAAAAAAASAAAALKTDPNKPIVSDQEAKLLKEVMQKKEALNKTQADFDAFKKQFEGIDPVAVRALIESQKTAETAALEEKGEWGRLKERMAAEHTATVKTLSDQVLALQTQISDGARRENDLSIGNSFAQSQFISSELTLTPAKAKVVYSNHFELVDGKVVGYDKPKGEANRTPLVDASGNPVAFDAALRKIVDADPDKNALLKSTIKPGANSNTKKVDIKSLPSAEKDSMAKIHAGLAALNINGLALGNKS